MTDNTPEIEDSSGPPSRYINEATARLSAYAKAFEGAQKMRKASQSRKDYVAAEWFFTIEKRCKNRLGHELRTYELWPFLEPLKGLAGPLTARAIGEIGDPLRFPGQKCSMGHTLAPFYQPGTQCLVTAIEGEPESEEANGGGDEFSGTEVAREFDDGPGVGDPHTTDETEHESETKVVRCVGVMLSPRFGSGVRSLWHYAGLHVVRGRLPRHIHEVQSSWKPALRVIALGPKGLADQIIMHRCEPYRSKYDEAKERGKNHKTSRIIAVKAFYGDLLIEWKSLHGGAEANNESEMSIGPSAEETT